MQPSVRHTIERWTRASNRRRLAEELLVAATWVAISFVIAAGCIRLADLVQIHRVGFGSLWPSKTAQWAFAAWAIGWVAKISVTRALWRYRKRRIKPEELAAAIDRRLGTTELWATAFAIEQALATSDAPRDHPLLESALEQIARMREPIEPFREPLRTIAGIGVAAALVALLPGPADAGRRPPPPPAEDGSNHSVESDPPPRPTDDHRP